jgi:hypothetical protein
MIRVRPYYASRRLHPFVDASGGAIERVDDRWEQDDCSPGTRSTQMRNYCAGKATDAILSTFAASSFRITFAGEGWIARASSSRARH